MTSQAEIVFRREWGRAVAVVTRLTGDLGLAEDAVQEAFASAVGRWASGPLPTDPSGWLITVAKNHALDWLRREARRSGKEQAATLLLGQRDPAPPPGRIGGVLRVVYLVFTEGHQASTGSRVVRGELCDEAVRLARLLAGLCPDDPEVLGLLALLLLTDARRDARARDRLVLLEEQDRSSWDHAKIDEGTRVLDRATQLRRPGPYQLQAAIAACHAAAGEASATDWAEIAALYAALARHEPSPVVHANRAVAVAMAEGPAAGLAILDELRADSQGGRWHLLHACRADLLRRLGRTAEAGDAYRAALALDPLPAEREFLAGRLAEIDR